MSKWLLIESNTMSKLGKEANIAFENTRKRDDGFSREDEERDDGLRRENER